MEAKELLDFVNEIMSNKDYYNLENEDIVKKYLQLYASQSSNRVGAKESEKHLKNLRLQMQQEIDSWDDLSGATFDILLKDYAQSFSNSTKGTQEGLPTDDEIMNEARRRNAVKAFVSGAKWMRGLLSRPPKEPEGWISVDDRIPTKKDADSEDNVLLWENNKSAWCKVPYDSIGFTQTRLKGVFEIWKSLPPHPQTQPR